MTCDFQLLTSTSYNDVYSGHLIAMIRLTRSRFADNKTYLLQTPQNVVYVSVLTPMELLNKQESLADAKGSARQQCVYEGP